MKKLIEIISECPVALRGIVTLRKETSNGYNIYQAKGLTLKTPFPYGHGIALSYECDNMGKTLLHEALHIARPQYREEVIESLTECMWKYQILKKECQKRIVYELGKRDL
jgi:hypothetical protein